MKLTNAQYAQMVKKTENTSPMLKNCIWAFCVGGLICTLGQLLMTLYKMAGLNEEMTKMLVPVTLVFLSALLTGLNVYDNIAKHAGAGTIVPITGFANAVVSPAMEFKNEGWVLGMGAKMFIMAGPVIVFGVSTSILYGVILWIISLF